MDEGGVRTIVIAGALGAEHVPELFRACGQSTPLRVHLHDLLSVDPIAADALRRIRDAGAELVGAPQYIQFKLDSIAGVPPRP
jgi:hypothetical protein